MINSIKTATSAKAVCAYLRVSATKQGIDGLGIKAQEDLVRARAAELGLEVKAVFKEVESGRKNKRPQLRAAFKWCVENDAHLGIAAMSRLTRNPDFMSRLAEVSANHGVGIFACDIPELGDPAQTKLLWRIMASVNEFEVEQLRARTKRGLAVVKKAIKKDGFYMTKEKRVGTQIVPPRKITSLGNPNIKAVQAKGGKSMKANAKAFALRTYPVIEEIEKAGITSLRGIAKALNARGILTYQDDSDADDFDGTKQVKPGHKRKQWGPETVKRVINQAKGK